LSISSDTTVVASGWWTYITIFTIGDYVDSVGQGEIKPFPADATALKQYIITTDGNSGGVWSQIDGTVADALILDNAVPLEKLNDGAAVDDQVLGYTAALGWHAVDQTGGVGDGYIIMHEPVGSVIGSRSGFDPTVPGNYIDNNLAEIGKSFFYLSPDIEQGVYVITDDTSGAVTAARRSDWSGAIDTTYCHIFPVNKSKDVGTYGGLIYTSNFGVDTMTWTNLSSYSTFGARYGHASISFNGELWIFGGFDGSVYLNDIWHSTDGKTWTSEGNAAWSGRMYHVCLEFNGNLWILGGRPSVSGSLNEVWYSPNGINWTQETAAGWTGRYSHFGEIFDGKMWVMGGYSISGYKNDVWWTLDGHSWTQEANASWTARRAGTCCVYDSKMWVIGGSTSGTVSTNDVWFTLDGNSWSSATLDADFPTRTYHTTTVYDSKMWVIGGQTYPASTGTLRNDVWSSSDGIVWEPTTVTATWKPRSQHTTVVFANEMCIVGGVVSYVYGDYDFNDDVYFGVIGDILVDTDAVIFSSTADQMQYGIGDVIIHQPCIAHATNNITLTACPKIIDAQTISLNNRIYLGKQSNGNENGIYKVTADIGTTFMLSRTDDWCEYSTLRTGTSHIISIWSGHLWGSQHTVMLYVTVDMVISPGTGPIGSWTITESIIGPVQDVIDEVVDSGSYLTYQYPWSGTSTQRYSLHLTGDVSVGTNTSLSFAAPTEYQIPFETSPMVDDLTTTWTANATSTWTRNTTYKYQGLSSWRATATATTATIIYAYRTFTVPAGHAARITGYTHRTSTSPPGNHGIRVGTTYNDATYGESFTSVLGSWFQHIITTDMLNVSGSTTIYVTLFAMNSAGYLSAAEFDALQVVTWANPPLASHYVVIDAEYYPIPTFGWSVPDYYLDDTQQTQTIDLTEFWGDDRLIQWNYSNTFGLRSNILNVERSFKLSVKVRAIPDYYSNTSLLFPFPDWGTPAVYPW
jgi:hypothetical protein